MKKSLIIFLCLFSSVFIFAQSDTIFLSCSPSCSPTDVITCQGFTVNTAIINEDCPSSSDGEILLNVSGGVAPYSFVWSNGAMTQNINTLMASAYMVTISDAENCVNTYNFTVDRNRTSCCTVGASCTDFDPCTINDQLDASCNCVGVSVDCSTQGQTERQACNDGDNCTINDSLTIRLCDNFICVPCLGTDSGLEGTSCDDGDNCTTSDVYNSDCECEGVAVTPCDITIRLPCDDGVACTEKDSVTVDACDNSICVPCAGIPLTCSSSGATTIVSCDDGDACTINDVETRLICDNSICVPCQGVSNGIVVGAACDDGKVCTTGETYDSDCNCQGGTQVTACDDNNQDTYNDTYDSDCNCSGTPCGNAPVPIAFTPSCVGDNDGTFQFGSGLYTFISTGTSSSSNFSAGTHTMDVQETATGCTWTITAVMSDPSPVSIVCGSEQITISGGTGFYPVINWSNGDIGIDIPFGTNTVTVEDQFGCTATLICTRILDCTTLTGSLSVTDVLCNGDNTGSIDLTVSGGHPPYSYGWSNGSSAEDAINLVAGVYTVIITDDEGCQFATSATVTEPDPLFGRCGTFNGGTLVGLGNVSGGVGGYTYQWGGLGTGTGQFTNYTTDGIYSVTLTDGNGCTLIKNCNVGCPSNPSTNLSASFLPCAQDGELLIEDNGTLGGTASYTFNWSDGDVTVGNTMPDHYVPCGEFHQLTIEDINGCFSGVFNANNSACACADPCANISLACSTDGTNVYADVTGSNGLNQFQWSDGYSSSGGTQSSQGVPTVTTTYTVTVTDQEGCTDQCSITITGTCAGSPCNTDPCTTAGVWDASCSTCTGQVDIDSDSDGIRDCDDCAPNDPNLPNLGFPCNDGNANTYGDVYVGDGCTCQGTQCPVFTMSFNVTNPSCVDEVDGFAQVIVSGGNPPYSYNWNNGANSAGNAPLGVGTHTVTVTDNFGCTGIQSVILQAPACDDCAGVDIVVNSSNVVPSCFGESTGSLDAAATGGTAPYSYAWSDGSSGTTLSNANGIYQVTVTDADGCTAIEDFIVPSLDDLIIITEYVRHPFCKGDFSGGMDISVTGSQGALSDGTYTYLWSDGAPFRERSGILAGVYTVTVTETNYGCTATATIELIDPNEECCIQQSVSFTTTCADGLNNGEVDLTIIGGTAPTTVLWEDGSTLEDRTDLAGGRINFTTTDNKGCINEYFVDVPCCYPVRVQRDCDNAPISNAKVLINGLHIGTTDAQGEYTITNCLTASDIVTIESTGDFMNGIDGSDLAAIRAHVLGTPLGINYQLYAADANNGGTISIFDAVQIVNQTAWTDWIFQVNTLPTFNASVDIEADLGQGFIFDATKIGDIDCDANPALMDCLQDIELSAAITDDNGTGIGAIDVSVVSGSGALYYVWYNAQTGDYFESQDLTGLDAGTYRLYVSDGNGCSTYEEYIIVSTISCPPLGTVCNDGNANTFNDQEDGSCDCVGTACPVAPVSGVIINENSCDGANDGSYLVNPITWGTAPYTYLWSNGDTSSAFYAGLGTYTLIVTDANGCTGELLMSFNNTTSCASLCDEFSVSCSGIDEGLTQNSGEINTTVSGGTAPYTFDWSNGSMTQNVKGLSYGNYEVTVTDANGCTTTCSYFVCTDRYSFVIDATRPSCVGGSDGAMTAITIFAGGTAPYTYKDANGNAITFPVTGLTSGYHDFIIVDANGCESLQKQFIHQPKPIVLNCGNTELSITGGSPPYSVTWSDASTGLTIPSGNVTATVTDSKGCTAQITCESSCDIVSGSGSVTDDPCGDGSGAIDFTPIGATAPITYLWSNSATTEDLTNVGVGNYTVTYTDANGCTFTSSYFVGLGSCPSYDDLWECLLTVDSIEFCPSPTLCSTTPLEISIGGKPHVPFNSCVTITESAEEICLAIVVDISGSAVDYIDNQSQAIKELLISAAAGKLFDECTDVKLSIIPHGMGSGNHCATFGGCTDCICATPMTDDYNALLAYIELLEVGARENLACETGCNSCYGLGNNDLGAIDVAVDRLTGCKNPILVFVSDGVPNDDGSCGGSSSLYGACADFNCKFDTTSTHLQNAIAGTDITTYGVILSSFNSFIQNMNTLINDDPNNGDNVLVIESPKFRYDLTKLIDLIKIPTTVNIKGEVQGCGTYEREYRIEACNATCFIQKET